MSTWAKLKNTNVLELSGLGMFRGRLAMISPWMELGSVKNVLRDNPSMDPYAVCEQLAEVIRFIHDLNVVHGDIKGDNLLMGPEGNIKLTDFGLSVMQDKTLQFSSTEFGGGGTLRWMESRYLAAAPELHLEDAKRTKEADMYAVGMTMLELVTGKVPFAEITNSIPIITIVAHKKRTPDISYLAKETISPRAYIMIGAMHRCWRYDPKERIEAKELVKLIFSQSRATQPPAGPDIVASLFFSHSRQIYYRYVTPGGPRKMDITCCDMEPAVLARNILLFALIDEEEPTSTLWDIFFHFHIDKTAMSRLTTVAAQLSNASTTLENWKQSKWGSYLRTVDQQTRQFRLGRNLQFSGR
ncbi:Serine/threonine-protein kinase [Ceratobasidium sp. AG-Ba]|nr:Serine/threonine-protein kinase [Ceratobasidium sp. AG-Ba]